MNRGLQIMAFEVTATRKRPKQFDELAGQEFVVSTLKNSISSNRIAHAYLFAGPRGVGKTSAARILARAINCQDGPTETPCGTCACCTEILRGSCMDVLEIDGASNTSVNDVRAIKDEVLFAPNICRYKVYIIDEVHMLSNSAFNALLKTIEEPPPYIVFIFATTEIHKVPATIRSRCQQFNFRLIQPEIIFELLKETAGEAGIAAEEDALLWIAKEATGSLRDGYTLFDQVASFSEGTITLEKIKEKLGLVGIDELNTLLAKCAAEDRQGALIVLDNILSKGISIEQFIVDCTEYFRSVLFIQSGITKESILGYKKSAYSETVLSAYSPSHCQKALELLLDLYRNIRYSMNQKFELELAISRIAELKNYIDPAKLVKRLADLEHRLLSAGGEESSFRKETKEEEPEVRELSGPSLQAFPKKEDVVAEIKKKRVSLASALEKAVSWEAENCELLIRFDTGFPGKIVNQEIQEVTKAVEAVTGKKYHLTVEFSEQNRNETGGISRSEQAELVKRIFRGEIV